VPAPPEPAPPPGRLSVWLNCAVSLDGRLAFAEGARARLSSPEDLERVHRLRAAVDGIVVGVGTVLADDPSLHVRWELVGRPPGPGPQRIILDSRGRIPERARVLDGSAPTIVATTRQNRRSYPSPVRTVIAGDETVDLGALFEELRRLGLRRLLVEGGAAVLASVVRAGLFDRWTIYYAPVVIGGSRAPPMLSGRESHDFAGSVRVKLADLERLGDGFLATFVPEGPGSS